MRKNEVAVVEKKANKGLSKVKKAVAAACGHAFNRICGTGWWYTGNYTAS